MTDIDTDDVRTEARQGPSKATQRDNADIAIAHMKKAISHLRAANWDIDIANARMEVGSELADERNGIADIISDLTGRIKELEQ